MHHWCILSLMKYIKQLIHDKILSLRKQHNALTLSQDVFDPKGQGKSLTWSMMELKKAFKEFQIAILRAVLGDDK